MTAVNVQFTDESGSAVLAYFGAPQDATVYPNQGVVELSDARWATFYSAMPKEVQQLIPAPS